jgi:hypothetical protein
MIFPMQAMQQATGPRGAPPPCRSSIFTGWGSEPWTPDVTPLVRFLPGPHRRPARTWHGLHVFICSNNNCTSPRASLLPVLSDRQMEEQKDTQRAPARANRPASSQNSVSHARLPLISASSRCLPLAASAMGHRRPTDKPGVGHQDRHFSLLREARLRRCHLGGWSAVLCATRQRPPCARWLAASPSKPPKMRRALVGDVDEMAPSEAAAIGPQRTILSVSRSSCDVPKYSNDTAIRPRASKAHARRRRKKEKRGIGMEGGVLRRRQRMFWWPVPCLSLSIVPVRSLPPVTEYPRARAQASGATSTTTDIAHLRTSPNLCAQSHLRT